MNSKIGIYSMFCFLAMVGGCGGEMGDPSDTVSTESNGRRGGVKSGRLSHLVHSRARSAVTEYYCWWNAISAQGNGVYITTATVNTSPSSDCSTGGTISSAKVKLEHKVTQTCRDGQIQVMADAVSTQNGANRNSVTVNEGTFCGGGNNYTENLDTILSSTITWGDGSTSTIFNDYTL